MFQDRDPAFFTHPIRQPNSDLIMLYDSEYGRIIRIDVSKARFLEELGLGFLEYVAENESLSQEEKLELVLDQTIFSWAEVMANHTLDTLERLELEGEEGYRSQIEGEDPLDSFEDALEQMVEHFEQVEADGQTGLAMEALRQEFEKKPKYYAQFLDPWAVNTPILLEPPLLSNWEVDDLEDIGHEAALYLYKHLKDEGECLYRFQVLEVNSDSEKRELGVVEVKIKPMPVAHLVKVEKPERPVE